MLETQYNVDHEHISDYFALDSTIRGMFEIFEELFGLVFEQINENETKDSTESGEWSDLVWHEDVQIFAVWDDEGEGGEFVGYLYMDLHSRDGKWGNPSSHLLQ